MALRTIVEVHILQTVPPSNINRDDTGSPKTAIYGGVRRARVSSQAWKKATRTAFESLLDKEQLGVRTKRVVEIVAGEIRRQAPSLEDRADALAKAALEAVGLKLVAPRKEAVAGDRAAPEQSGYLVFLSRRQVQNLAAEAVTSAGDAKGAVTFDKKRMREIADQEHSVDIALFGRMVADQADINVDAAAMVAHAISVHAVETEFDYFTAVDDTNSEEETGAGMIGTVEFNSSTLYRYATVDADRLQDNLGSVDATRRAVSAFVEAFVRSMPTGKQNTFANRTLPEAVVVMIRDRQPINLVGAFEAPIADERHIGRIKAAVDALAVEAKEIERAYGETPVRTWVTRVGTDTAGLDDLAASGSFAQLVAELDDELEARLGGGS